jgi:hypothetical protein
MADFASRGNRSKWGRADVQSMLARDGRPCSGFERRDAVALADAADEPIATARSAVNLNSLRCCRTRGLCSATEQREREHWEWRYSIAVISGIG